MFGVVTAGPGHEQDPHLPCADVGIYAAQMADPSGTFAVDSWPPTGTKTQVYSGTWTYTAGQPDPQEIAVIPISALAPGGHFKLKVGQNPGKFKTFWIDCPSASPTPSGRIGHGHGKLPPPATTADNLIVDDLPAPAGAVAGDLASAGGEVLAMTGTPIGLLLVGLVLLIGGLGFYSYRRIAGRTTAGA